MKFVLQTWQVLLVIMAGGINKHQHDVIEYLLAENRRLREQIGKKRILLNDVQRRRLAIKVRSSVGESPEICRVL